MLNCVIKKLYMLLARSFLIPLAIGINSGGA